MPQDTPTPSATTPLAGSTLGDVVSRLAARTPAPGGGAAAAAAAAIGCAIGAMAARYTTGPKWAAVSEQADTFARSLDDASGGLLALADADAAAYAAVSAAAKSGDQPELARAQARAAAIPADMLAACALQAASLRGFLGRANPRLASDVKAGIHLLAGAGRAAWQTLAINAPPADVLAVARAHLRALDDAESGLRELGA